MRVSTIIKWHRFWKTRQDGRRTRAIFFSRWGFFVEAVLFSAPVATRLSLAMPMQPLVGTVELEESMIVILVYCGVAYTQMTGNHMPF
jgi:hypothetical protein